jgi:hypothetical protein
VELVILSEEVASRSEATAQSKDPYSQFKAGLRGRFVLK